MHRTLCAMNNPTVPPKQYGFYVFVRSQGLHAVYVVHSPGNDYCKVGVADEPYRRLGGIQGGNWSKLEIYDHWWTTDPKLSRRVEQETLLRLAEVRACGEWVKTTPEKLSAVVQQVAADFNIGLMKREDLEEVATEWHKSGAATSFLTNTVLT